MKITIDAVVDAPLNVVWEAWNGPGHIQRWNAAQDDWHTPRSTVDLREGGKFTSRMEAKDGSMGFDFEGIYTRVEPMQLIEYRMADAREARIVFEEQDDGIHITETFDAESVNPPEMQRQGWQAILDNFRRYVEQMA